MNIAYIIYNYNQIFAKIYRGNFEDKRSHF